MYFCYFRTSQQSFGRGFKLGSPPLDSVMSGFLFAKSCNQNIQVTILRQMQKELQEGYISR